MSAWWSGSALGFDTETDGPEPTEARIITAGLVNIGPGHPPQEMETMLVPERPIPDEAIAIHGITNEHAKSRGVPRELGVMQVALTIAELASPVVPLVGHNASYDLTLLDRELRRLGLGRIVNDKATGMADLRIEGGGDVASAVFPVLDTYVLDKALDRYRRGSRKLTAAAEFYGVPMAEGAAHGAVADVLASLRIAWRMSTLCDMAYDYIEQYCSPDRPLPLVIHPFTRHYGGRRDPLDIVRTFAEVAVADAEHLHMAEVLWAAEQAAGLRDYFATTGKGDPATVDGSWPVRPIAETADITTELV